MDLKRIKNIKQPKIKTNGTTPTKDTAKPTKSPRLGRGSKMITSNGRFGQTELKHSKKGIASCMYAVGVWIFLFLMLLLAFFTRGGAPTIIGALGIIAFVFGCIGLRNGLRGFREREKNYVTCKIGLAANGLVILVFILLFIRGLF